MTKTSTLQGSTSFALVLQLLLLSSSTSAGEEPEARRLCFDDRAGVCLISISTLIGNEDALEGETLTVVGYLAPYGGDLRLFASEDAGLIGDVASSIRISDRSVSGTDLDSISHAYVSLTGRLQRDTQGRRGNHSILVERAYLQMRPEERENARRAARGPSGGPQQLK